MALSRSGVHRPSMIGIAGTGKTGAESIVLNGGYEDDEDLWDYIVYTGQGGNDLVSKRQIADQVLTRGNHALARSCDEGLPVRVVRGWREPTGFGPKTGYRYDGLYYVESYWQERGRNGFLIWRFRLVRDLAKSSAPPAEVHSLAKRRADSLRSAARPSSYAEQQVRVVEGHACQVCGVVLRTLSGPYAETVYIRPLGSPHGGTDSADNTLCLCPNHRVLFQSGGIIISPGGDVVETTTGLVVGRLRQDERHRLSQDNLAYHSKIYSPGDPESARS
jgi:putative restriction endonuclease